MTTEVVDLLLDIRNDVTQAIADTKGDNWRSRQPGLRMALDILDARLATLVGSGT